MPRLRGRWYSREAGAVRRGRSTGRRRINLNESQLADLRKLAGGAQASPLLTLAADAGQPLSAELAALAEALVRAAPCLRLAAAPADGELPLLEIGGLPGRMRWSALPEGREWPPFLLCLQVAAGASAPAPDPRTRGAVAALAEPQHFEVHIAPGCPHCPRVVRLCATLALVSPLIRCHVIDAAAFTGRAAALGIRSTPAVVLEGVLRLVGEASTEDLVALLGEGSWEPTIRSLADTGTVDEIVRMLLDHPEAAGAVPALLTAEQLSRRMAALRTFEVAAAVMQHLVGRFLEPLGELLYHADPRVRGDAAYGLGLLGNPAARPWLLTAWDDPDPDVREAVREALAAVGDGNGTVS